MKLSVRYNLETDEVEIYADRSGIEYKPTRVVKTFEIVEPKFVQYIIELLVINNVLPLHTEECYDFDFLTICLEYTEKTKKALDLMHSMIVNYVYGNDEAEVLHSLDLSHDRKKYYTEYAKFIRKHLR